MKDDEEPKPLAFAWRKVPLEWRDEDGEELSSVVLDLTDDEPPSASAYERSGTTGLGANQETALKVLRRLYRQCRDNVAARGAQGEEAKVLLSGLRGTLIAEKRLPKQRVSEAIDGLEKRGLVRIDAPHIYLSEGDSNVRNE